MKAPTKLTVIIRSDAPMLNCADSPSYRTVVFELTDEQRRKLILDVIGKSYKGGDMTEAVSQAILE